MANKYFDVDSILQSMISGKSGIPYRDVMTEVPNAQATDTNTPEEVKRMIDFALNPNSRLENSQPQGQIPYQQMMTEVPNSPEASVTDAVSQQQAAIRPKINKTGRPTFSQFPPQAQQAQQAPQDNLMNQLEAALMAKRSATQGNVEQFRALASQLGQYKPTPSFGGLIDYANFQAGTNIKPVGEDTGDTRVSLLNRLQQQIAQGRESATQPGIDLAEAKIKMQQYKEKMAESSKERELDRDFKKQMLKEQINARMQQAALAKGSKPTPLDRKISNDYATFIAKDAPNAENDIGSLEDAISMLQTDPSLSGPAIGLANKVGGAVLTPKTDALKQRVHNVIYSTLKPLLGSQFTQQEGEILKNLSFNPTATPQENITRISNLMKRVNDALAVKQQMFGYFENNNFSMSGFKGVPKEVSQSISTKQAAPSRATQDVAKMTEAELDAYLASKGK